MGIRRKRITAVFELLAVAGTALATAVVIVMALHLNQHRRLRRHLKRLRTVPLRGWTRD